MEGLRLSLDAPPELVEAIAARAAEIVLERLEAQGPAPDSPFFSIDEAAGYMRCTAQRVYDLRSSGRLTKFSDGTRAVVSRAEVDALLGFDAQPSPIASRGRNGSGIRR
jgi:excisionase family DNA binding protein